VYWASYLKRVDRGAWRFGTFDLGGLLSPRSQARRGVATRNHVEMVRHVDDARGSLVLSLPLPLGQTGLPIPAAGSRFLPPRARTIQVLPRIPTAGMRLIQSRRSYPALVVRFSVVELMREQYLILR
jgi:hypothetical protein